MYDVKLGDWDLDGDNDLVASGSGGHVVVERLGLYTFAQALFTPVPHNPFKLQVDVARIDCNRRICSFLDENILLLNPTDPGGPLRPPLTNDAYPIAANWLGPIIAADFTSDGQPDILISKGNLTVLPGLDGELDEPLDTGVSGSKATAENLAAGDLDRDGDIDIVKRNEIYLNNGDGLMTFSSMINGGEDGVALADLNGDGDLDLVTFGWNGTPALRVFANNSAGVFNPISTWVLPTTKLGSIRVGDVNGDGHADLLISRFTSNDEYELDILFGQGSWSFSAPMLVAPNVFAFELGNSDGDGDDEICAIVNGDLVTYKEEDGTFEGFLVGDAKGRFEFADVTGDGLDDIVDLSFGTPPYMTVWAGTILGLPEGAGVFHLGNFASLSPTIFPSTTVDLDSDGDLDIVAITKSEIAIIRNLNNP